MKLKSAQVKNFRCIDDSTEFSIGDVTCLVGKNESGKTSILKALELIKSVEGHKVDGDRDFPRKSLTDFDPKAVLTITKWELSDEDVIAIETSLGSGCVGGKAIEISHRYNGSTWNIQISQEKVISWLLSEAGCDATERAVLKSIANTAEVKRKAAEMQAASTSPRLANLVQRITAFRKDDADLAAIDIVSTRLPKFLYFAQYDRMNGSVSLEALQQAVNAKQVSKNDEVFLAFLAYAGTSLKETAGLRKYEQLTARVEAASIKISNQIFKYWSQNKHLKVKFTIEIGRPDDAPPFNSGNIMRTRILNELHEMTVPFDERSAGFVWFFSFLVYFSQIQKTHGDVIILLDEPGLNLHGKAQGDLLRFIEKELRPKHQVIYTTHSPFMVPPNDLASVRTVEDVVNEHQDGEFEVLGTKVGDRILSSNKDTLFPLQGALGYEITQTLFVGKNTLLVEGPSDILYLQAASAELGKRKRTSLNPNWTICPAGGIDKVGAFISLFSGNSLNIAVLTDLAAGTKAKIEDIRRRKVLEEGRIFTAADFCKMSEADIEDFFGDTLYLVLANQSLGVKGKSAVTTKTIEDSGEKSPRILKRYEAAARLNTQLPDFDHFRPAYWLIQNASFWEENEINAKAALDRFEQLFISLNKVIQT